VEQEAGRFANACAGRLTLDAACNPSTALPESRVDDAPCG